MPRNPRRSTSMGMNSLLLQDTSPTSVMGSSARPVLPPFSTRTSGLISGLPTSLRETAPMTTSPSLAIHRNEGYFPPIMPSVMEQVSEPTSASGMTERIAVEPRDSLADTVMPVLPNDENVSIPPPSAGPPTTSQVDTAAAASVAETAPLPVPIAPSLSANKYRRSSRSTLSPKSRDVPLFAPSSLGRSASVASSHSTQSRGLPIGGSGGKSAPAMAITSSTGSGNFSPGSHGFIARPPSQSSFSSQRDSGSGTGTGTGTASGSGTKGSPLGVGTPSAASTSTSGGLSSMARTISRGFSIKPQRTGGRTSSAGSAGGDGGKGQSAADILKQYGESK